MAHPKQSSNFAIFSCVVFSSGGKLLGQQILSIESRTIYAASTPPWLLRMSHMRARTDVRNFAIFSCVVFPSGGKLLGQQILSIKSRTNFRRPVSQADII